MQQPGTKPDLAHDCLQPTASISMLVVQSGTILLQIFILNYTTRVCL